MHPEPPVALAVVGAGNRGADVYARYALEHPDQARVVAVAEPDPGRRRALARAHGIPAGRCFDDWRRLLAEPRLADAVVIATPDRVHVEPALAALEQGYDVLLEKPIAPEVDDILRLAEAARKARGAVTVAHVLRYTPFFTTIQRLLAAGAVGRPVVIEHQENIGYWHFAHSYVRGNWRRAAASSPMILAKACHDLDLLRWFAGAPCAEVASFGALVHFRPENAPAGVPARCTDGCPAAASCPFDAVAMYVDGMNGRTGWPVSVVTPERDREARLEALRRGPYGRCVYRCDNDVVDHQVVSLRFVNGLVASLTVAAFTVDNTRTLRVLGTRGELQGHMERGEILVRAFRPGMTATPPAGDGWERILVPAGSGHAGGDQGLMQDFIRRLRARRRGLEPEESRTSLRETVESHLMALAAEQARRERRVVRMEEMWAAGWSPEARSPGQ
ncbi:MAG TPA: Gfo/Idh/MocA family oxidoreductase [Bacillota bacterium]